MITGRQFWLTVHVGLGALFIHAFAGGFASLLRARATRSAERVRAAATAAMAAAAWLTVILGTWIVYPWYRAEPGDADALSGYPQAYLTSNADLTIWHDFAMEWKEHIGWLSPFLATAVAVVVIRHRHLLTRNKVLKRALTAMFALAFAAAVISGALGAVINNVAPNRFLDM